MDIAACGACVSFGFRPDDSETRKRLPAKDLIQSRSRPQDLCALRDSRDENENSHKEREKKKCAAQSDRSMTPSAYILFVLSFSRYVRRFASLRYSVYFHNFTVSRDDRKWTTLIIHRDLRAFSPCTCARVQFAVHRLTLLEFPRNRNQQLLATFLLLTRVLHRA